MAILLHRGDLDLSQWVLLALVWVVLPTGILVWLAFWYGKRRGGRK
ncbi:MAG TPA: hypothetical protein VE135_03600 [Pyrinomonadaceae bacterium]|nr:hypothetical protein [Pyrinomonadaceae bacterium]